MNTCYDYLWVEGKGFICNTTLATHYGLLILLAIFLVLGLFSVCVVLNRLNLIVNLLRRLQPVTAFQIFQRHGDKFMAITGVKIGATGTFQITDLPLGAQLPSGQIPEVTASDPSIVLTQPTADNGTFTAAVPAGSTLTSFTLTVSAPNAPGAPSSMVSVPVLPADVTSFQVDQIS
jgi:hypothetical protein